MILYTPLIIYWPERFRPNPNSIHHDLYWRPFIESRSISMSGKIPILHKYISCPVRQNLLNATKLLLSCNNFWGCNWKPPIQGDPTYCKVSPRSKTFDNTTGNFFDVGNGGYPPKSWNHRVQIIHLKLPLFCQIQLFHWLAVRVRTDSWNWVLVMILSQIRAAISNE